MVELRFKKLTETAQIPRLATENAACFDLVVDRIEEVAPGKIKLFFGLACEFPDDYKLCIVPRSSFNHKDWVMQNSPGQVDPDYRGEIAMYLQAFPVGVEVTHNIFADTSEGELVYPDSPYQVGDRAAQAFLQAIVPTRILEVGEVSVTKRGTGGFGSTGVGELAIN